MNFLRLWLRSTPTSILNSYSEYLSSIRISFLPHSRRHIWLEKHVILKRETVSYILVVYEFVRIRLANREEWMRARRVCQATGRCAARACGAARARACRGRGAATAAATAPTAPTRARRCAAAPPASRRSRGTPHTHTAARTPTHHTHARARTYIRTNTHRRARYIFISFQDRPINLCMWHSTFQWIPKQHLHNNNNARFYFGCYNIFPSGEPPDWLLSYDKLYLSSITIIGLMRNLFYRCGDDTCIPPNLYCDGYKDCNDGSDENPQICKLKPLFIF